MGATNEPGSYLVKAARGGMGLAAVIVAGLLNEAASAQDIECINPPVDGPAGSEMCYFDIEGETRNYGVTADGSVIVGYSYDGTAGGSRAFRWVEGGGMESLGALSGGTFSAAYAVNADGSVVVGESESAEGTRAFRWVEGVGMAYLGNLQGGLDSFQSVAFGVNADGSVVVGDSGSTEGTRAFRWVEGVGMESLGTLSGGNNSYARSVNADGSVVVGVSESTEGTRAFRWVEGVGMESLGNLSGGFDGSSQASAVNADGSVVVGGVDTTDGAVAFRWVEGVGMESLGTLSGGATNFATGVSADGTVVVGYDNDGANFIWREDGSGIEDYDNLVLSFPVLANDSAIALAQSQFAVGEVMDQTDFVAKGQVAINLRAATMDTA